MYALIVLAAEGVARWALSVVALAIVHPVAARPADAYSVGDYFVVRASDDRSANASIVSVAAWPALAHIAY